MAQDVGIPQTADRQPRISPLRALPVLPALPPGEATPPRSVRLSLTDRCDLACIYCRPHKRDGYLDETLDVASWKTMVAGLVQAGVRRVRLTGGEPLLYPHIVSVTAYLASLGLEDLALTTNATRLARLAQPLREAGLHRLNISLDTLDAARFSRMTRGGRLAVVLDGIEAAQRAGFEPLKINAVVVRGENDSEIEAIVRWCWQRGIVPRLLEVMAIGEGAKIQDRVVTAAEMRLRLAHLLAPSEPEREPNRGPAKYVRARHDPTRRVGFITGTSDTYCKGCDRLRVAGDGTLRPCLATNDGVSGGDFARRGDSRAVADAVAHAWTLKPDGDTWKGCTEATAATLSIRGIGG
jgi:GTP 3',8-cyclase